MSHCPSSAYNCQTISQSQKISIGIVEDSVAPQPTKKIKFSNTAKDPCNAHRLISEHNVGQVVKSLAANIGQFEKPASSSAKTHYVQTARDEALLEHGVARKRDAGITSQKKGNKSGTHGRSGNFSAVCNQTCVSVTKELPEQTGGVENSSKEALRMKLRQIFGTNPFSYDKVDSEQTLDVSTHQTMLDQNAKIDRHSKLRQNSDTIETDSENVSLTTKRPVTRSFARYKAPTAGRTRNLKPKCSSFDKEAKQCNSISSSGKKPMPSQDCAVNRGCLPTEHTDGAKKSCGIKPDDLPLPLTGLKNIQLVVTGDEKSTPAKELPLRSVTRSPPSHGCLNENIELQDSENPVLGEKSGHQESLGFKAPEPPQEDHNDCSDRPLFKMTTFVLSSSPPYGSPPKDGPSIVEDKFLTMSSSATKKNNDSDSSDGTATPDDRFSSGNDSSIEEKDADDGLFTPGKGESDSTDEVSSMKRAYMEDVQTSSEIGFDEKPIFFWKRHRSQEVDLDDVSPVFTISKAGGKPDDIFMEASEENADNGSTRVISLLGLALEKVKSKMALATNRRCLDILMSASEEIHSQLQDVESQIQTDVRKLTCLKTFKRKHLETRLQEQQERLKVIHEKFIEEIQMYLQDCRGAVEGLEAQHVELKGAIEAQKASQRKLVSQAEAAVENHISDTHRKIMSVCKMRQKKMQQLKVAIGECLKDVMSG
ncbi:hypothetical protein KSS87_001368 [Heliosperma pusillum]|nr:hypothetical protein KSS87_001368 [Heliosperma pusillum]